MYVFWLVFSVTYLLSPTLSLGEGSINVEQCQEALSAEQGFHHLNSVHQTFFRDVLLPAAGMRVLYEQEQKVRKCSSTKSCFTLIFDDAKDLKFEWVSDTPEKAPWIETGRELNTMKLPTGYSFDSAEAAVKFVRRFLIGHPLHPFNANREAGKIRETLGEPQIIFKEAQKQAIEVGERMIEMFLAGDRSKRKYGVIGPTGFGKSEILKKVIKKIMEAQRKENLHVVLADQNRLVAQLIEDIEQISGVDGLPPLKIIRWGGDEKATSIAEIIEEARASDVPVVLATSVQSFRDRVLDVDTNLDELRDVLASFSFDEGHHLDAELARRLIENLIDHEKANSFMYATTATPFRPENENYIYDIFGVESESVPNTKEAYLFWCYLDQAKNYFDQDFTQHREVKDVIAQLRLAITSGELTPFDKVYFIEPDILGPNAFDAKGLREQYFEIAIRQLLPLIITHRRAFFTIRSQERAKKFSERLSEILKEKGIELTNDYSYSGRPNQDKVWSDFKSGKTDILVSVRQFDEGINVPDLSLYLDLNKSVGVRQLLQRMGRVLRIFEGKEYADVVLFLAVNSSQIREMLELLHEIRAGTLRAPPKVAESRDRQRKEAGGKDTTEEFEGIELSEVDYLARIDELIRTIEFWDRVDNTTTAQIRAKQINDYVERLRKAGEKVVLPFLGGTIGSYRNNVRALDKLLLLEEEERYLRNVLKYWFRNEEFREIVDDEIIQLMDKYENSSYEVRLGMDVNKLYRAYPSTSRNAHSLVTKLVKNYSRESELWKHVDEDIFKKYFSKAFSAIEKNKLPGDRYGNAVVRFREFIETNGYRIPTTSEQPYRAKLALLRHEPKFTKLLSEKEKALVAVLDVDIEFNKLDTYTYKEILKRDPYIRAIEVWFENVEALNLQNAIPPPGTVALTAFRHISQNTDEFDLPEKTKTAIHNTKRSIEEAHHKAAAEEARKVEERKSNSMPAEKLEHILKTQQMKGSSAFQTFLLENAVFEYANADEVLTELIKVDPNPLSVFLDREEVFNHYASLGEDGLKRWGALVRTAIDQDTTGILQDYLFGEDASYEYPDRLQYIPQ